MQVVTYLLLPLILMTSFTSRCGSFGFAVALWLAIVLRGLPIALPPGLPFNTEIGCDFVRIHSHCAYLVCGHPGRATLRTSLVQFSGGRWQGLTLVGCLLSTMVCARHVGGFPKKASNLGAACTTSMFYAFLCALQQFSCAFDCQLTWLPFLVLPGPGSSGSGLGYNCVLA